MPGNNNNNAGLGRAIKRAEYLMKKKQGEINQAEFNAAMAKLSGGRRTLRGGNTVATLERRMAERAACYNANVRGVKPSNANAKACVDRLKAAASGGRRTRRGGAACNGVVSKTEAMKRKNCQWESTKNGMARLVPKLTLSNNGNGYSGGRRTRRSTRRSWF